MFNDLFIDSDHECLLNACAVNMPFSDTFYDSPRTHVLPLRFWDVRYSLAVESLLVRLDIDAACNSGSQPVKNAKIAFTTARTPYDIVD